MAGFSFLGQATGLLASAVVSHPSATVSILGKCRGVPSVSASCSALFSGDVKGFYHRAHGEVCFYLVLPVYLRGTTAAEVHANACSIKIY